MADFASDKALSEKVDSQLDMVESQLDIVDKPSLPPVAAYFGELVKAIADCVQFPNTFVLVNRTIRRDFNSFSDCNIRKSY